MQPNDGFCSNCGQKNIERLKVRTLLGELANAFFAWDSKLFRTLKPLFTKPGEVSKRYLSGKRKNFVAPMRLYLFASLMFFIFVSIFGTRVTDSEDINDSMFSLNFDEETSTISKDSLLLMAEHDQLGELDLLKDSEEGFLKEFAEKSIKVSIQTGNFLEFLQKNISIMFFVFIPVFGWILKLFYLRKKFDYIEHLVFGLYLHAFIFFTLFITLAFGHIIGQGWPIFLGVPSLVVYLYLGLKNFYEAKWFPTLIKTIFILALYLVLFTVFSTLTIGLTIWFY
jgi:hypothetical protein